MILVGNTFTTKQDSDRERFLEMRRQQQQRYVQEKQDLQKDTEHFQQMKNPELDESKKAFLEKRKASQNKETIHEPTRER